MLLQKRIIHCLLPSTFFMVSFFMFSSFFLQSYDPAKNSKFPFLSKPCFPAGKYHKHLCKHSKTQKNTKWRALRNNYVSRLNRLTHHSQCWGNTKKWIDMKNNRSKNTFSEKSFFMMLREMIPLYLRYIKCTIGISLDFWIFEVHVVGYVMLFGVIGSFLRI